MALTNDDLRERFDAQVEVADNGCHLWTGVVNSYGYPRLAMAGRSYVAAHRFIYQEEVGPLIEGMAIDHLCRTRHCVNPDHLEQKTIGENTMAPGSQSPSALNAAKTHCVHGHEFSRENTYVSPKGARACRACRRNRATKERSKWARENEYTPLVEAVRNISKLLDQSHLDEPSWELRTRRRIDAIIEDVDDVMGALRDVVADTPRKARTHDTEELLDALMDVAISTLGVYESLTAHEGRSVWELGIRARKNLRRLRKALGLPKQD